MTSIRDLKREAQSSLSPLMEANGFRPGNRCSYYRVVGDGVYQAVIIELYAGGTGARVFLSCTVPELYEDFEENKFPPRDISFLVGGRLSAIASEYVGNDYSSDISTDVGLKKFFLCLPPLFHKWVFPFFESIKTRRQFWEALDEETRNRTEYARSKDLILYGRR